MSDADDDVSRRYRELPREEPPPAIDAAILAAARRRAPSRFARWAGPVSIAAVLMLGIGISVRMQTEEPVLQEKRAEPLQAPAPAAVPEPPAAATMQAPAAVPGPPAAATMQAPAAVPEPPAAATMQAPATAAPAAAARSREAAAPRAKREAADAAAGTPATQGFAARSDPAAELERIAKLRESGAHAEADRLLEAFRARHPGHRIPEPMWERVKPR